MVATADTFTEKFRQIGNVPTLPAAATRALAVVNDPKSTAKDMARIVESDPALATSLLKLVNSSYYSGGTKVNNLTLAVSRLGMRETQNLVLAVSVRSVFRWMPKDYEQERDRLWRHSGLTGVLCRQLNEKLGLDFKGEEFTAGLSHDLGRIMLAVGYPDVFCKLAEKGIIDECLLLKEEEQLLGFCHAELGGWLLEVWNMPVELIESIRYHHAPQEAPSHATLAAVVSMAEEMANHMEEHHSVEGIDLSNNPGWLFMKDKWPNLAELEIGHLATAVMVDAVPEAEALALIDLG